MLIGLPWFLWLPVATFWLAWKLFEYFLIVLWFVLLATGRVLGGLLKLLGASWQALVAYAERRGTEKHSSTLQESIKAKSGPRDYNLP